MPCLIFALLVREEKINAKNKNPIQIDGNIIENVDNF
jgi:hypothetical protein